MREIWFRGKRLDNGQWIEGWLIRRTYPAIETTLCYIVTKGRSLVIDTVYPVDPSTAGQYTGLRDKNGKMIFEGDIIKIPDDYDEFGINAGEVYEVYFSFGGFRLKPKYSKARGYWLEDDETVEVIGNIHDNPELLEANK